MTEEISSVIFRRSLFDASHSRFPREKIAASESRNEYFETHERVLFNFNFLLLLFLLSSEPLMLFGLFF